MPNPLILHDFYTPKVGEGAPMLEALRKKNEIWLAQGLPGFSFLKPFDGPHNAIVTVQKWNSFEEWESIRGTLPGIKACRSVVFEDIYPTNLEPYYTRYYEEVQ